MILNRDYISLEDCLLHLKIQVVESLAYVRKEFPAFTDADTMFAWLKERVTYLDDPEGVELLQMVPTLVAGTRTGKPWAGDCDCFTILSLSCLIVNGFTPYVILTGRKKDVPVHIYAGVEDSTGIVPFDLTNDEYGIERKYKYQQILPFKI